MVSCHWKHQVKDNKRNLIKLNFALCLFCLLLPTFLPIFLQHTRRRIQIPSNNSVRWVQTAMPCVPYMES